jgi:hypothetical protein
MLIFNFVYIDEIIKFLTETFHRIYYAFNVFINLILNNAWFQHVNISQKL